MFRAVVCRMRCGRALVVAEAEQAGVAVALDVLHLGLPAPAPEGFGVARVDVAGETHPNVGVGHPVVAAVAQEEAPVGALPEGGDNQPRAPPALGLGEVAEQKAQRGRNVANHEVEGAGHDLLTPGITFIRRGVDVEVRVGQVAGSIAPVAAIDFVQVAFFFTTSACTKPSPCWVTASAILPFLVLKL